MIYKGAREKGKNAMLIFRKLSGLFKVEKYTAIPKWLNDRKKGEVISKANAASKIIHFAETVKLTQSKLREIYEVEKEYEISKIKAQDEFPHVPVVMMKLISEARDKKLGRMKFILTKSQFAVYAKMFRKSRQHY